MAIDLSEVNPFASNLQNNASDLTSTSLPLTPINPAKAVAGDDFAAPSATPFNDGSQATQGTPAVNVNDITVTDSKGMRYTDLSSVPWQSNPLSNYRNCTYSFTLSACSDSPPVTTYEQYVAAKLSDENKHVIIAETANSRYNIVSCDIQNMAAPNFRNCNANATSITMTITEPLGVSFFDSLKNAAEVLKIQNYGKMYYFLELSFKAYNEDGSAVNKGSGGVGFDENQSDAETGRKKYGFLLWKVLIKNIETTINEGGGTYTLSLIPVNEHAFTDNLYRLASPTKCSGTTTNDAINSLAKMLNDDVKKRYLGREILVYKFEIMNDRFKQFVMRTDEPFSTNSSDVGNDGLPSHQSGKGQTIGQMIDAIFLNSTMVKEWEEHFKNPQDKLTTAMNILRVESDVEYGLYDPIVGDYVKTVTYRIYPYEIWRAILSKEQYDGRKDKSTDIFSRLVNNNFLKKRYDYIYTGQNSEILSLDLRFNVAWSAIINVFDGARHGYAAVSEAPLHNEGAAEQIYNIEAQVMRGLSIIENYMAAQEQDEVLMDDGSKVSLSQEAGEMATIRAELIDLGDQYQAGQRDQYETKLAALESRAKDVVERASILERKRARTVFDRWATTPTGESRFKRYAEDVESRTNKELKEDLMPVTFHRTPTDVSGEYGGGGLGDWNVGKAVMSSVLNQTYGVVSKDLQVLTMEIKGDPYWFGGSNMEQVLSNVVKSPADFPHFALGEHAFLLTFQYPVKINDDTHEIELKSSESFNGVYMVKNVHSSFSHGAFKQSLEATRCNIIVVDRLINEQFTATPQQQPVTSTPKTAEQPPSSEAAASSGVSKTTVLALAIDDQEDVITQAEIELNRINAEKAALQSKINIAMANGDTELANALRLEQSSYTSKIAEQRGIIEDGTSNLLSLREELTNRLSDPATSSISSQFQGLSSSVNSLFE